MHFINTHFIRVNTKNVMSYELLLYDSLFLKKTLYNRNKQFRL